MKLNIWIYSVCYKEVLNLLNVTEDHTSPEELDKIKVCYYFFRRETENIFQCEFVVSPSWEEFFPYLAGAKSQEVKLLFGRSWLQTNFSSHSNDLSFIPPNIYSDRRYLLQTLGKYIAFTNQYQTLMTLQTSPRSVLTLYCCFQDWAGGEDTAQTKVSYRE